MRRFTWFFVVVALLTIGLVAPVSAKPGNKPPKPDPEPATLEVGDPIWVEERLCDSDPAVPESMDNIRLTVALPVTGAPGRSSVVHAFRFEFVNEPTPFPDQKFLVPGEEGYELYERGDDALDGYTLPTDWSRPGMPGYPDPEYYTVFGPTPLRRDESVALTGMGWVETIQTPNDNWDENDPAGTWPPVWQWDCADYDRAINVFYGPHDDVSTEWVVEDTQVLDRNETVLFSWSDYPDYENDRGEVPYPGNPITPREYAEYADAIPVCALYPIPLPREYQ